MSFSQACNDLLAKQKKVFKSAMLPCDNMEKIEALNDELDALEPDNDLYDELRNSTLNSSPNEEVTARFQNELNSEEQKTFVTYLTCHANKQRLLTNNVSKAEAYWIKAFEDLLPEDDDE